MPIYRAKELNVSLSCPYAQAPTIHCGVGDSNGGLLIGARSSLPSSSRGIINLKMQDAKNAENGQAKGDRLMKTIHGR